MLLRQRPLAGLCPGGAALHSDKFYYASSPIDGMDACEITHFREEATEMHGADWCEAAGQSEQGPCDFNLFNAHCCRMGGGPGRLPHA